VRTVRVLAVGWFFHLKMLMRDPFNGLLNILYPLFFATVAFFMFRVGGSEETLLYASLGASVMGIWSATSTSAGAAMQRERWHGTLELLIASPTPFGIELSIEHPLVFALSIPATVVSIGTLGFLMAVAFVRHRAAWALGNLFEYPVWLICGFLVPLSLLPEWVRPISWALAPTWGMNAIRESALGGDPLLDIAMCAVLGALYTILGVTVAERMLSAARARATLSLT
jgi:ABC-2 type transport system permease protein